MSVSNPADSTPTSGVEPSAEPQDVVPCGAMLAQCGCAKESGHGDENHECRCGGKWYLDNDGNPVPVLYPGGLTYAEAIAAVAAMGFLS